MSLAIRTALILFDSQFSCAGRLYTIAARMAPSVHTPASSGSGSPTPAASVMESVKHSPPKRRIKVAYIVPDNRDELRKITTPGPTPLFGPSSQALIDGFHLRPDDVELHVISCWHHPMAAPRQLAPNIFFHGLHVPTVGWQAFYVGCVLAIRRRLALIGPDLVHGRGTERYCGLAAAFSGYANVTSIMGNMRAVARALDAHWNSFHAWTARLESIALRKTGGVICNSAYTEQQVAPIARRTWRIPNALRLAFFETPPPSRITHIPPRLINVGSIVPYKRQVELMKWARDLHQRGVAFQLDFIGDADESDYARAFLHAIAELPADAPIRFSRRDKNSSIIDDLDHADGLIHVSTEESFGLVVAEALARNCRVFATTSGGVSDIMSGMTMAQRFATDDWAELAEAVAQWASTPPQPADSSMAIRARFHPAVIADAHLALYRLIINGAVA